MDSTRDSIISKEASVLPANHTGVLPPFLFKTYLEIPRGEEERFSHEGSLGWGPGSNAVGVIFRNDVVGYLPSTISEQILPFLHSPGLLRFSLGAWREVGETVDRVKVHVTPLLPDSEMDQQHATALRKLHDESNRMETQLNGEYHGRRKRQQLAVAQVPVDILCNVGVAVP